MDERERFVPRRVGELTTDLATRPFPADAPPGSADGFRALSRVVAALVHVELLEREREVTEAWEVIGEEPAAVERVVTELRRLVELANFVPLEVGDMDAVLVQQALVRLRLEVHLDDYQELVLHRRGAREETFVIRRWRGLRTTQVTTTVDDRVVVFSRIKPADWFAARGVDPTYRNLTPGAANLKLFRDVPRPDLEMLLPATRVRFRRSDTLKVGVPALASAVLVATTKLLPTIGLVFLLVAAAVGLRSDTPRIDQEALVLLLGGVFALGLYVFRQWKRLENRRTKYLKVLNENLYFRTVADGSGVFHTLYASAEEQEIAEILLAYRFLLDAPDGLTAADLDEQIEAHLTTGPAGTGDDPADRIDFEIDDAVAKLRRLGIVEDGPRLRAVPLAEALALLDHRWQALFRWAEPSVTDPVPVAGRSPGEG